jgi:hypothetical protein
MTREQAIKAAKDWLEIRKEVRLTLIEAAREAHPQGVSTASLPRWESNEIRKLYQFPTDLSEQRLLGLIGEQDG